MRAVGIICTVIVALQIVFTLGVVVVLSALDEADRSDAWDEALADLIEEES